MPQKLKLLHVSLKMNGIFYVIFPIMSSIVRVSDKRLSKAQTCCHHIVHISKLDILDYFPLRFKV